MTSKVRCVSTLYSFFSPLPLKHPPQSTTAYCQKTISIYRHTPFEKCVSLCVEPFSNIHAHYNQCCCYGEDMCIKYVGFTFIVAKRLTNNLQVVYVADSGLYERVVLRPGHTLQVALMVRLDIYREVCHLPLQGGVFSKQPAMVTLPGKGWQLEGFSIITLTF